MLKYFFLFLCAYIFIKNSGALKYNKTPKTGIGRIIGGDAANATQFPFLAAIYKITFGDVYFCTGTLLFNQWVITSGQCVDGALLFNIRLGSNSLSSEDVNLVTASTETYYLHPDFDPTTLDNDIGIIKLRESIPSTDYIQSVNVVYDKVLPAFSPVVTVGWGQTSDEIPGVVDILNYVSLITLSTEDCRLIYGNQISDDMICTIGEDIEGTCVGDLGVPLLQYFGDIGPNTLSYLVGVSTFISSRGCNNTDPSGFTRTSSYIEWINEILWNTP